RYFTKITRIDEGAKREKLFYRDVQAAFPQLKEHTPAFQSVEIMDDVQYLTVEHIEEEEGSIKIEKVINVARRLGEVPYAEIVEQFPNPQYPFIMRKNTGPDVVYLFTKIHDK